MSVQTGDTTQRPFPDDEDFAARVRPWWVPWAVALVVAGLVIGVGSYFAYGRDTDVASMDMRGDGDHVVPPVTGFYEGQEVHFIHTEASDPQVAGMLSAMMNSPVIVVPDLRDVPAVALGNVFVFANGVRPDDERGPFGFQPDVFDTVPGDSGYSPLRVVHVVTWEDTSEARALRSVGEIEDAEAAGELTIDQPGVVVNMPIIDWPGGGSDEPRKAPAHNTDIRLGVRPVGALVAPDQTRVVDNNGRRPRRESASWPRCSRLACCAGPLTNELYRDAV